MRNKWYGIVPCHISAHRLFAEIVGEHVDDVFGVTNRSYPIASRIFHWRLPDRVGNRPLLLGFSWGNNNGDNIRILDRDSLNQTTPKGHWAVYRRGELVHSCCFSPDLSRSGLKSIAYPSRIDKVSHGARGAFDRISHDPAYRVTGSDAQAICDEVKRSMMAIPEFANEAILDDFEPVLSTLHRTFTDADGRAWLDTIN